MIDLGDYKGQTLAIMGLDRSGLPAVRALKAAGARILAWDDNEEQHKAAREAGAEILDLRTADITGLKTLILSPGIPHRLPSPHPIAARFIEAGAEIICDIELFARSNPLARVIGITGTNGKSTTTALIGHILKSAGIKTAVGGNIGTSALGLPMLGAEGVYVLELSSYQLERSPSLALDVAVMLNLSPDHLSRHGDLEGYRLAKAAIFKNPRAPANPERVDGPTGAMPATTSLRKHESTAVYGIDDPETKRTGETLKGWTLAPITASNAPDLSISPNLKGSHNAQNAAAAFASCRALGLSKAQILTALQTYPGLPHRQQLIANADNLRYINDSKATNADSAARALACYDEIYWIAGGRPKETGLEGLETYMPRVRRAFLIGEAEADFARWCEGKVPYERCGNLSTAVRRAAATAKAERRENAVVLLSPACASWDQFRSFEHRGEAFAALVHELTEIGISARSSSEAVAQNKEKVA